MVANQDVALPHTLRMKNATAFCFQSTKARAHQAKKLVRKKLLSYSYTE
jgi:hypothetical protein